MKDGVRQIIGKTIKGVVISAEFTGPESQVFLIFDDGTYYEFYGTHIHATNGVIRGDSEYVVGLLSARTSGKVESCP